MKTNEEIKTFIKENPAEILELLSDVASDFEVEGCDGCGTITIQMMNQVHRVLGWKLVEEGPWQNGHDGGPG